MKRIAGRLETWIFLLKIFSDQHLCQWMSWTCASGRCQEKGLILDIQEHLRIYVALNWFSLKISFNLSNHRVSLLIKTFWNKHWLRTFDSLNYLIPSAIWQSDVWSGTSLLSPPPTGTHTHMCAEIRHTDILADTQHMETWHVLILKSEDLEQFLNKVPRITLHYSTG